MEGIMEELRKLAPFAEDAEVSIECNPGTVHQETLCAYKSACINRISFGLQSCHDEELKVLGRIHTYEAFLKSFEMAREAGFTNINVDLMSGLPRQTYKDWEKSLRTVAQLGAEHISAYSLIIEEGTPFSREKLVLPEEETERRMYEGTYEILKEYGYEQYEISNYAKDGFACRHNIGYWTGTEYLGFGLGAASLYQDARYHNTKDIKEYVQFSHQPEHIRYEKEVLDQKARMEEYIFLGMRMLDGVSLAGFQEMFSEDMLKIYGNGMKKMEQQGLVSLDQGRLKLTRPGISLSNYVFGELLY
jgi:oxygen-independent coproporphyrinogen-3 oxidase